jgi:hypothetical protein
LWLKELSGGKNDKLKNRASNGGEKQPARFL